LCAEFVHMNSFDVKILSARALSII